MPVTKLKTVPTSLETHQKDSPLRGRLGAVSLTATKQSPSIPNAHKKGAHCGANPSRRTAATIALKVILLSATMSCCFSADIDPKEERLPVPVPEPKDSLNQPEDIDPKEEVACPKCNGDGTVPRRTWYLSSYNKKCSRCKGNRIVKFWTAFQKIESDPIPDICIKHLDNCKFLNHHPYVNRYKGVACFMNPLNPRQKPYLVEAGPAVSRDGHAEATIFVFQVPLKCRECGRAPTSGRIKDRCKFGSGLVQVSDGWETRCGEK